MSTHEPSTFGELLFERSIIDPPQIVFAHYGSSDEAPQTCSLGALDRQARILAARMLESARHGDRALLLLNDSRTFVPAFVACLYGGIVAVTTHMSPRRSANHLRALIADADPRLIVSSAAELERAGQEILAAIEPLRDRLMLLESQDADVTPLAAPVARPDDIALLQYTSGSTGRPRGVMVSHANLMAATRAGSALVDPSQGKGWFVSWMPLFHDLGLVGGVLQPLYDGCACALLPPTSFVLRPMRWLSLISDLRAIASSGPNFAYELCVERIGAADRATLDLSSWRVAICGAEPVRAETVARFTEAFAPVGFQAEAFAPCYGLAEATLGVSGVRPGAQPIRLELDADQLREGRLRTARRGATVPRKALIGCGAALPGTRLAIVDPATDARAAPGTIGEIWVSGGQVTAGYWNDPDASEGKMRASLADTPDLVWLCTGDLGFLHNEELFVVGRMDDMLLVRGRNHAPQDIERTAESADNAALRPNASAAFLAGGAAGEGLVLVAEVRRAKDAENAPHILASVRGAVAAEHGLDLRGFALLRSNQLPRTTSGKVRRKPTAEDWRADRLACLFRWDAKAEPGDIPAGVGQDAQAPQIARWLIARCTAALGVEAGAIDPEHAIVDLGLSSSQVLVIAGELADWLGREIEATLLVDPDLTISGLARRLELPEELADTAAQSPGEAAPASPEMEHDATRGAGQGATA